MAYIFQIYMLNFNKINYLPYFFVYAGLISILLNLLVNNNLLQYRLGSEYVGSNGLAYFLVFSLISSIFLTVKNGNIYFLVFDVIIFFSIILTGSRQALLVIIILLGILLITETFTRKKI